MTLVGDLGKGTRAMTYLKTVPILRQRNVNVKVIYVLEGREERDRGGSWRLLLRALNLLGTPGLEGDLCRINWTQKSNEAE